MKTIAVTNLLPFYITTSKDTPSTLRSSLLKTLTNKSQRTKESSTKSLFDPEDFDLSLVPRPLFLTHMTLDCPIVGFSPNFSCIENEKIKPSLRRNKIHPISYSCKKVRDWSERLRNIFECRQWNDVFLKNSMLYSDYKAINRLAVDEIRKIYEEGDVVWVCDAEYWLVPGLVREDFDCVIGVTVNVPFPDIDIFRSLPAPADILKSLLMSDYIEFQDINHLENFVKCCEVFVRAAAYFETDKKIFFTDREINLSVNKIGIDSEKIKKITEGAECKKRAEIYRKRVGDKKLIVSVTKRGDTVTATSVLMAYEALMGKCENVSLFLVEIGEGVPDYEAMNENKRLIDFIEINHPGSQIEIFYPVDDNVYYALLSVGDIGLMIDERDAIGKSAMEFMSCGEGKEVITSKFATWAVNGVNPKDYMEIAETLYGIISNSGKNNDKNDQNIHENNDKNSAINYKNTSGINNEKKINENIDGKIDGNNDKFNFDNSNSGNFRSNFQVYNPKKWIEKFTQKLHNHRNSKFKTLKDTSIILEKYKTAEKRLICLDYDGTLTKLVKDSNKATPDQELLTLLETLSNDAKNEVFIITGRTKENIDSFIKNTKIKISAEHGHFMKDGTWSTTVENYAWKDSACEIMQFFVDRTPGSKLEIKESAVCFHYRGCEEFVANVQRKALKSALCKVFDERVIDGNRIIEIKSKDSHKGQALRKILNKKYDFIIVAGDDTTDEDMFREIVGDEVFSVKVGEEKTKAKYRVRDVKEMRELLIKMGEM